MPGSEEPQQPAPGTAREGIHCLLRRSPHKHSASMVGSQEQNKLSSLAVKTHFLQEMVQSLWIVHVGAAEGKTILSLSHPLPWSSLLRPSLDEVRSLIPAHGTPPDSPRTSLGMTTSTFWSCLVTSGPTRRRKWLCMAY